MSSTIFSWISSFVNLCSFCSSLSFFSSSVKYCSMWLLMRFMRSSSLGRVKFWSLEFTALNLLPSIDWYSFPKRSILSQKRFHCRNTCFRGFVLSFRKLAMVLWSGCRLLHSYMALGLLWVSLSSFGLDLILL